ncbi:MAG: hypothetical protein ACRBI6_04605 [Acidimicrobiales bacterium]
MGLHKRLSVESFAANLEHESDETIVALLLEVATRTPPKWEMGEKQKLTVEEITWRLKDRRRLLDNRKESQQ